MLSNSNIKNANKDDNIYSIGMALEEENDLILELFYGSSITGISANIVYME